MLKNGEGEWIDDPFALMELVRTYFSNLYTEEGGELEVLQVEFPTLDGSLWAGVARDPDAEEVKRAIRAVGALKALGKDGLNPIFFQKCWETVGPSLVQFILDWWANPGKIREVNSTILVLILKVLQPIFH
ncbi:unnamed protein product [Linum trigynum]|uniref:Uncharacterized protein n=1 Tax=Linum trigynum TaxID=586398 RepID=A0AAV2FZB4_9ROSI